MAPRADVRIVKETAVRESFYDPNINRTVLDSKATVEGLAGF